MQVLYGETRVTTLVERVVRWASKGDQGHKEDVQTFPSEEYNKLVRVSKQGSRDGGKDDVPNTRLQILHINRNFQFSTKAVSVDQKTAKLE